MIKFSPYYKPGPDYPDSWNRLRHFRFAKDGYICQLCGKFAKGDLHLHHIIPIHCVGSSHHYDNLTCLCSSCHKFVHSGNYDGPLLKLKRNRDK